MIETKTELANFIIEDGQPLRSIHNYINETFEGVANVELFDLTFTDRIEFFKYIQLTVMPVLISTAENWKDSEPEEYENSNKVNLV